MLSSNVYEMEANLIFYMLVIVLWLVLEIGHDEMEMNHMDLLVVMVLFLQDFCKDKLKNVLEKLLRFCLRKDNNIFFNSRR